MLFEPEMLEAIEPDGPPGLLRIAEEVIKFVPTAYHSCASKNEDCGQVGHGGQVYRMVIPTTMCDAE